MAKKRGVPAHGRESARFHRARKKRYLVVAGGAVTERQYFKQLESIYDVVIDYQQKNESPEQLADFACKLKKEDERDISVVSERLRTLDHARPWRDDRFASGRLSSSRDMSR